MTMALVASVMVPRLVPRGADRSQAGHGGHGTDGRGGRYGDESMLAAGDDGDEDGDGACLHCQDDAAKMASSGRDGPAAAAKHLTKKSNEFASEAKSRDCNLGEYRVKYTPSRCRQV